MKAAVYLCVAVTLALVNGAPHGFYIHDPVSTLIDSPGSFTIRKTTASVNEDVEKSSKGSFNYAYNAEIPEVVAFGERLSDDITYSVTAKRPTIYRGAVLNYGDKIYKDKPSGSFSYSLNAEAPLVGAIVAPGVRHSVVAEPVHTGYTSSVVNTQDSTVEGGRSGTFSYSVTADSPLLVSAPALGRVTVPVTYQQDQARSVDLSSQDKPSGSFSYSFNAEAPAVGAIVSSGVRQHVVAEPVHAGYISSLVNTQDSTLEGGRSGAFSYSVKAGSPLVVSAPALGTVTVPVTYQQDQARSVDLSSRDKPSGSFSYSFNAEAPAVGAILAPEVRQYVVAEPVHVGYTSSVVNTQDSTVEGGRSGAFSYSVTADSPLVVSAPAVGTATVPVSDQQDDVTSVDLSSQDKPSGSFSYSFNAEAPLVGAIVAPGVRQYVVAEPVHTGYTSSVVNTQDSTVEGGRSGAFSYSVTADSPLVVSAPAVGTATVPVSDQQDDVTSVDLSSQDKPSGSFSYSFNAEAPAVGAIVAPEVRQYVVAEPVHVGYTSSVVNTQDSTVEGGRSGAFSYSVTADSPLVVSAPALGTATLPVTDQQDEVRTVDLSSQDKPSGSFSYSFNVEAPAVGAIVVPEVRQYVVAEPVHVGYTSSVVNTQDSTVEGGRSGAFSYSVTADSPLVVSAPAIGTATLPVTDQQDDVTSVDLSSQDKPSGSFSYSFNAEAPLVGAIVAPGVRQYVVAEPVHTGYTSSVINTQDSTVEGGRSGAFSYSVTADSPLVVSAPARGTATVPVSDQQDDVTSVDLSSQDKPSGSFSYSFNAEAPAVGAILVPGIRQYVVAEPVHAGYTSSVVNTQDSTVEGGRSGAFSYSVTADSPLVVSSPALGTATVPVTDQQDQTRSVDLSSQDKPSGSFSYSFNAEAPLVGAIVAPGVRQYVVAEPVHTGYTSSVVKTQERTVEGGRSGAFSYSVTADSPLVVPAPALGTATVPVVYQQDEVRSADLSSQDKASGSFSYSFNAKAPLVGAIVAPVVHHSVVAEPVHAGYITSPVYTDQSRNVIGESGVLSYTVSAEGPSAVDGAYFNSAPVERTYAQSVVNFGDKISKDKTSGSFSYSYNADAQSPAVPEYLVSAPVHADSSSSDVNIQGSTGVGGKSGALSYFPTADSPLLVSGAALSTPLFSDFGNVNTATAKEIKLQSIGYNRVFGVRTAPVRTVITGYENTPIGYGVPITIKCD